MDFALELLLLSGSPPQWTGQIRAPHALETDGAPLVGQGVAGGGPEEKSKRSDKWGTVTPDHHFNKTL